ncbi:MAG: site-specific integrase [Oscillospiraceae bacterium]
MARKSVERGISFDERRECYYVLQDFGRDHTGERVRQYKTYPTLALARCAREEVYAERLAHTSVFPTALTVGEWLQMWLNQVVAPTRAETTFYTYRVAIRNHLEPAFGKIPLQQLAPYHIQKFYAKMIERGFSPNTVRRYHSILSAALHGAMKQGLLQLIPTDRVEIPQMAPHQTAFYSPEELRKLYEAIQGDRLELIVHLAGSLGLRREEICGLRWNSVDFVAQRMQIRAARTAAGSQVVEKTTKNVSSTRVLYLADGLIELLKREKKRQEAVLKTAGCKWTEKGYVAANLDASPLQPNQLTLEFARFIRKNHLPKITLHGLRHTFATVASAQGAPLFDIGKALGHSTPAITGRIYTHLLDQTHQAVMERVSAALC